MSDAHREPVRIRTVVERKRPDLPRYVVVPSASVSDWRLTGTTVVDVRANGVDLGRRALKFWGKGRDRSFIDLAESHCAKARIDTGDSVVLELRLASTELPSELAALIDGDARAAAAWARLTEPGRRQLAEHVRAAKRLETRRRRAATLLGGRERAE